MGGGAGFGVFGGPVFGGEGYAPEGGARVEEFQAYFGSAVADGAQENHVAVLFFLGAQVLQEKFAAAGNAGGHQNQGAVGVDGEGFCFFGEIISLGVVTTDANGNLHQDALAATAGHRWMWGNWRLGCERRGLLLTVSCFGSRGVLYVYLLVLARVSVAGHGTWDVVRKIWKRRTQHAKCKLPEAYFAEREHPPRNDFLLSRRADPHGAVRFA